MTAFIVRRLLQTILVVFALSFVSYSLLGLMPGDPLDIACQANPYCTPENLEQMKKNLGLDQPVYVRYGKWVWTAITELDLGYSRTYRRPVSEILVPRLINTFFLSFTTLLVSLCIAIPLGVFTSLKANTKFDYIINMFAFLGISLPSFWLALMLIIVFSIWMQWFPAGGTFTVGAGSEGFFAEVLDRMQYLLLPVISLSAMTIGYWVRFTRAKMLEVMRFDYIRTARAKGLTSKRVIFMHGLRNALIPVVTIIALGFSGLFSGAIITETVFAYQGAGKLIFDSIFANDYNVAMCSFVLTSFMVLFMNLIADICYAYLDPRISYS